MKIKNRWVSQTFKLLIVIAGVVGVSIQCGIFDGKYNFMVLNYYTLLSNVLCTLYFLCAFIYGFKSNSTFLPQLKGAVVMCITVTGLIYHFMLSGSFEMQGTYAISNILLHYVVPIMTFADWILFDEKGVYKKYSPLLWVIAPYIYLAFVVIKVSLGGNFGYSKYPYPFLDVGKLGLGQVILTVAFLTVAFILLGYLIYFIEQKMKKKSYT